MNKNVSVTAALPWPHTLQVPPRLSKHLLPISSGDTPGCSLTPKLSPSVVTFLSLTYFFLNAFRSEQVCTWGVKRISICSTNLPHPGRKHLVVDTIQTLKDPLIHCVLMKIHSKHSVASTSLWYQCPEVNPDCGQLCSSFLFSEITTKQTVKKSSLLPGQRT